MVMIVELILKIKELGKITHIKDIHLLSRIVRYHE